MAKASSHLLHLLPKDFTFVPDTLIFGANAQRTTVTAALQPTDNLIAATRSRGPVGLAKDTVTFIALYNALYDYIELRCTCSPSEATYVLSLGFFEKRTLYSAFQNYCVEEYGYSPKDMLNSMRTYAGAALL